jgi:hypothetical protein
VLDGAEAVGTKAVVSVVVAGVSVNAEAGVALAPDVVRVASVVAKAVIAAGADTVCVLLAATTALSVAPPDPPPHAAKVNVSKRSEG